MGIISVFSGSFCGEEAFIQRIVEETGYTLLNDEIIIHRASELSSLSPDRLRRTFLAKTSVFNSFTRERERSVLWLKTALAEYVQDMRFVLHGFTSHLLPEAIEHALRICLIADMAYRTKTASSQLGLNLEEAAVRIKEDDHHRVFWVQSLRSSLDPWDANLYDMVLPTNKIHIQEAVDLVKRSLSAEMLQPSDSSRQTAQDFLTVSRIESHLAQEGHFIEASVKGDAIVLTIDRPVLMLERLEEELKAAVLSLQDFQQVKVCIKPKLEQTEIYQKVDFQSPSKVLLVDDEREFVQTLSERLGMRNIGSAPAFDGERALALLGEDEPEVMLLDLRMPGIDGIEVLKRVKEEHPEIEVVILTGHGTDADRKECMALGAFDYLEKPVDIDRLSDTLKKAHEKVRENSQKRQGHEP